MNTWYMPYNRFPLFRLWAELLEIQLKLLLFNRKQRTVTETSGFHMKGSVTEWKINL